MNAPVGLGHDAGVFLIGAYGNGRCIVRTQKTPEARLMNEFRRQTVNKKLFSPEGGRIALSTNVRIAEFLDFAIQAKFAYVNKLTPKVRLINEFRRKG